MSPQAGAMERPQRWPLVNQQSNRSESFLKDARLVNAFAEKDPNTGEWWVQKRVGYKLDFTAAAPYVLGAGLQAFGQVASLPDLYSIFGYQAPVTGSYSAQMYRGWTAISGASGALNMPAPGGSYFFVQDQASPRHLVFADSAQIHYLSTGSWGTPTIPGYSNSIVGLAYLDQTIYFMDQAGVINNSAFNDPSVWTGSNVIANAVSGDGTGLVTQLNYLLAFKQNSMEPFYDAGNPPPGSPLSPVAGGLSNYGALPGTIQAIDNTVLFVTSNRTVSPQVARVDNLQVSIVSTPPVERMFDQTSSLLYTNVAASYPLSSWAFKHGGHRFYGVTYWGTTGIPGFTLVYDIDQNLWYQWTDSKGSYWPVRGMSFDYQGNHVLQGMNDGSLYFFEGDYEYPMDNGVIVPAEIITPAADFGTRRRKTLHRMYISTDQTPGSYLYYRRSDDDYNSWSEWRRIDLNKRSPYTQNEGTFTRRAYHFKHMSPTAFRIRSADLQMDIGTI